MIKNDFAGRIARKLKISTDQVGTVIGLLDEGSTIPFIARYRKEVTGELDEVAILNIRDQLEELKKFDIRVKAILKSLSEQDLLTKDLEEMVKNAETVSVLEDIYLPYKPKRRTRAMDAREKDLEPLADYILKNQTFSVNKEGATMDSEELSMQIEAVEGQIEAAHADIQKKIEFCEDITNLLDDAIPSAS